MERRNDNDGVVYLDVIFITELVMNYLVLMIYCKISRKRYRWLRRFLAVLFSSVLGVWGIMTAVKWSGWNQGCSLVLSLLTALLELMILQGKCRQIRQYVLELPSMLIAAACLAGGLEFFKTPFHLETLFLNAWVWGMLLLAGLTLVYWRQRGIPEERLKTVWITFGGETYTVTAITDTGNNLYDKISGLPVHIVEQESILKEGHKEQLLEHEPERITYVPYSSLGNPHGLLMVLQAEQLMILYNGRKMELKNQKVGLTDQKLDSSGRWQMLLHPDLDACIHEKGGCI